MPNIITPALLSTVFESFNFVFNDAFKAVSVDWPKVAMRVPSVTAAENYGWLGQFPRIREWIGDRQVKALETFGYQIRNRSFESTIAVLRDQIEDDSYGLFNPVMAEMGRSVAQFPDELVFPLLKAGFATNCHDGQFFFDVDHPVLDAAGTAYSASNVQAGSGPAWFLLDTTRAIKPLIYQTRRDFDFVSKTDPRTSDRVFDRKEYVFGTDGRCNAGFGLWQLAFGSRAPLNRATFRAARTAMINLKGDYGRPLGIMPNLLVHGPSLEATARDLIKSQFLPVDGSPGVVGAAGIGMIDNTDRDIVGLMMSPWLD